MNELGPIPIFHHIHYLLTMEAFCYDHGIGIPRDQAPSAIRGGGGESSGGWGDSQKAIFSLKRTPKKFPGFGRTGPSGGGGAVMDRVEGICMIFPCFLLPEETQDAE